MLQVIIRDMIPSNNYPNQRMTNHIFIDHAQANIRTSNLCRRWCRRISMRANRIVRTANQSITTQMQRTRSWATCRDLTSNLTILYRNGEMR